MSEFADFIGKDVKKQARNEILARALVNSSNKGAEHVKKQEINEENAEYIVAEVYDVIRELIEAKLSLDGYKSYSHEATVLFLKKFPEFKEEDIYFLDNLRKIRNGIKYYGKGASVNEAEKALDFMSSILPKLKILVKNVR
ncbi:MAG TPA: hypothetical protein VMZ91_04455 [Candidatus Paceibacterota bacterium]|nr:hypothetical protein [Candidatus Paceibacterota bacterium]